MIEERVEVVRVAEGRAWVQPANRSGCSRCDAGEGCGAGLWQRAFGLRSRQIVLANDQLQVGDQLLLSIAESALLSSAAMLYLLPLVTLIIGALFGTLVPGAGDSELWVLFSSIAGLLGGLLIARAWATAGRDRLTPGVLQVIAVSTPLNAVES